MATNIFGIDLGNHSLKVAVVEKHLRGYEVTALGYRKVEGLNGAEVSEAMSSLLSKLGFDGDEDLVTAVFPGSKLSFRTLTVPLTQRRQISEALPFEIEPLTPFDAEDFVCDYIPLKTEGKEGTRLLAPIALKTDLKTFLDIYSDAGIDPDVVVPAPVAAAMAVPQNDSPENENTVLLEIGHNSTVITLLEKGEPVAFHTVHSGGAEIAKAGAGDTEAMAGALDKPSAFGGSSPEWDEAVQAFSKLIAREVNRMLLSEADSEGAVPGFEMVTCGGLGWSEKLTKAICDELGCKAQRARITGDEIKPEGSAPAGARLRPTTFTAAIGAAVRAAEGSAYEPLNLRTGGFEKKRKFAGDKKQSIVAASLLGAVLVMALVSYVLDGARLGQKYEGIKQEIRSEFKRVLPDIKNIVSESQQLKNALAKIRKKSKTLGTGLASEDPFLDRLLDLSKAAPENMKLDIDELVYEWGRIVISGMTESFEKVEQLKKSIEELPWTSKVTVDRAKAALSGSEINFRLEITTI